MLQVIKHILCVCLYRLKVAKVPLAGSPPFISPENKENRPLPFMHIGSVLGVLNSSNSQLENLLFWRDYYGEDENCKSLFPLF